METEAEAPVAAPAIAVADLNAANELAELHAFLENISSEKILVIKPDHAIHYKCGINFQE